jgi:uncharacterized protein YjbI with pentapeptide repeats
MSVSEHVEKLRDGAESWNRWRADNPDIVPDLSGYAISAATFRRGDRPTDTAAFDFSRVDLSRCEFLDIALTGANFIGATLRDTRFAHGVSLTDCEFTNTVFGDTNFEVCTLVRCKFQAHPHPIRAVSFRRAICEDCSFAAELEAVTFDLATITRCDYTEAVLRDCSFINVAAATHCRFVDARLTGLRAEGARFIMCDFRGASFASADLFGAELTGSDFRGARGYQFDDNLAHGVVLSSEAEDYWSILRRAYTGARFGFNAVFLLMFFLPIAARAMFWAELGEIDKSALHLRAELRQAADLLAALPYSGTAPIVTTLRKVADAGLCGARPCPDTPVALLFLGWPIQWDVFGIISLVAGPFLIVYNALRGLITFYVLPMRDEEMRSGHTPRWRWGDARASPGQRGIDPVPVGAIERRLPGLASAKLFFAKLRSRYGWLVPLHWAVQVLAYIAYATSAVHLVRLLFSVVPLPA